ncbi:sigma-54 dependent transcriptional regulator [Treponema sp.]
MSDILIIDDEPGIRGALRSILEDEKYRVIVVEDAIEGIEVLQKSSIDLVFLDVWLPRLGGLEALEKIRAAWPNLEVVMISGHANVDMAVRAVKLGAFDFLEKPLSLEKVLTVTRNALAIRELRTENIGLKKAKTPREDEILGESPGIVRLRAMIETAASSDARILVRGENGTGKELVARAIHRFSDRSNKPFVEVNCAAIPDSLLESELFGHEKGAFTDAISGRKGRFELASGGTLFLDEIGDMSLSAQSKVLRAIQESTIERVGGEKSISIDTRIVAATNKDLETACRQGKFREDLFFRLNVIPISIPPLRERPEDIPILMERFLASFGAQDLKLDAEAQSLLQNYEWPGNVRELKNLAERIAVMCDEDHIGAAEIENLLHKREPGLSNENDDSGLFSKDVFTLNFADARDLFEKTFIERKLAENGYTVSHTAEAIGLYPSNLHAKIKKHGIRMDR